MISGHRRRLPVFLVALALALPLYARAPRPAPQKRGTDVTEIVAKTKALYDATKSADLQFEQSGATGTTSGRLIYAKGNKFRLEFPKQTFVSDGQKTWTYTPATKQVVISKTSAQKNRMTPNDILKSFPGDYAAQLLREDKVNGRGVWVVRCVPKGSMIGDVSEATLYIDKNTYRFQQISLTSPSLGSMTLRIISANYDANVPDSRFTFTPPTDARVIDLSK